MVTKQSTSRWLTVLVFAAGAMANAQGPGPQIPRSCPGGVCVPSPTYGWYSTKWRRWPGIPEPPVPTRPEKVPTPEPTEPTRKTEPSEQKESSDEPQHNSENSTGTVDGQSTPPAQQPTPQKQGPAGTPPGTTPGADIQQLPQGNGYEKLFPTNPNESGLAPEQPAPQQTPAEPAAEPQPTFTPGGDAGGTDSLPGTEPLPGGSTNIAPGPVDEDPFPDDPVPPPPGVDASPASLPRTTPERSRPEEKSGSMWRNGRRGASARIGNLRATPSSVLRHRSASMSVNPERRNPLRNELATPSSGGVIQAAYFSAASEPAAQWRSNPLRQN